MSVRATLLVEETVTTFDPPSNGSYPLWSYGSPPMVRDGEVVIMSIPETGAGVAPTANTRFQLFARREGMWRREYVDPFYNQREPCPIALLPSRPRFVPDPSQWPEKAGDPEAFRPCSGNRLIVSSNPSVAPMRAAPDGSSVMHYCEPCLLDFDSASLSSYPQLIKPRWDEPWPFTDHSYRGVAADHACEHLLVLNVEGYQWREPYAGRFHWCTIDPDGRTATHGTLAFPVRCCYPAVTYRDGAASVVAISDIDEPNEEWMAYKREATGQRWDFDFRNLYLAWADNLVAGFGSPVLLDSAEATAGHIRHMDTALDDDGTLHLVYVKRNVWKRFMRDRFFPELPLQIELVHMTVRNGEIVGRQTLMRCVEHAEGRHTVPLESYGPAGARESFTTNDSWPEYAALHTAASRAIWLIWSEMPGPRLRIRRIHPNPGEPLDVPVSSVPPLFFSAPARLGTWPSNTVDLMAARRDAANEVRYIAIGIEE